MFDGQLQWAWINGVNEADVESGVTGRVTDPVQHGGEYLLRLLQ
jgi:hypothetical protein